MSQLAARLRALRERAGLTLAQVASQSGLSTSMLSKVENGRTQLTYDKIVQLARGLEVDISELFSSSQERMLPGRRVINRADRADCVSTANYDYYLLSSGLSKKQLIPIFAINKSFDIADFPEMISHSGEEFTYVISGQVRFYSEAYEPVTLGPGDSVHFDSSMRHAYVSAGDEPARVISVCSNASLLEEIPALKDSIS
ncbi:helix-turn-helix domain-containing protein [Sphingomonas sp.]|uniref:helix-turn-helix domain-containing protein n=1 Tax=Sphingomonas sp. TaxID=28214 RepID=UPI002DF2CDE4|nr:helix-turn-helix domain-containing protein [Sphingomonas sp.]